MLKRTFVAILILVVVAQCYLLTSRAAAQDPGEFEGTVSNGTTGKLVARAPVRLDILQRMTKVATHQTTSDSQGTFRFKGLPVGPMIRYIPADTRPRINLLSSVTTALPKAKDS